MIQSEYLRFLDTLSSDSTSDDSTSDDVRKIANIVHQHLDILIPLSTARGQRVQKFIDLAHANWETVSPKIQPPEQLKNQPSKTSVKLKSLTVGPFRGFAQKEFFDLSSDLVLVYGPNGTGKSSFCEALEWGLLGSVTEATSRRFRTPRDYLKNAHSNAFEEPVLIGVDNIKIVPNEAAYRFCFVEKNRIDNFSRIAAQAPAKQLELISTLFGLESFNDFVRNFTPTIDGKYIDLEGVKAKLLAEKRKKLVGYNEQISTSKAELEGLKTKELALAQQYRDAVTFEQMMLELNGDEKQSGCIQKLEAELQAPLPSKSNLTVVQLQTLKQSIIRNITTFDSIKNELTKKSQDVSFKQLYEALLQVQKNSVDSCPACKTPLNKVTINPYSNAQDELNNLKHLSELQNDFQLSGQNVTQSLRKLSDVVGICCQHFKENIICQYRIEPDFPPSVEWWNSLHSSLQDGSTPWQHLEAQVRKCEEKDILADSVVQKRSGYQTELNRLRSIAVQATTLIARKDAVNKVLANAKAGIDNFDVENAQLLTEIEPEKALVVKNKSIASAYEKFVVSLTNYKNTLPRQLVADLGGEVASLYNAFNRNDSSNEQLAVVRLPLAQNEKLKVSFFNEPETFFDALHILSEGHIRCLGLAILLAKNIKIKCPLIIFDDPVNAIDEDHRESIRRTFFEDSFFEEKQIILACHGEELFKDIQNQIPRMRVLKSKTFTFLPRQGEQHIQVDPDCSPRNYILAAKAHLAKGEIRNALGKSRQALECLTKERLWRYVNKYGDGLLSIKLRFAKAPIELRQLTEQLRKKMNKSNFTAPNRDDVYLPIDKLLGMSGDSREWRYLNKGTHEESDRAEFDRITVQEIVTNLEQLDSALS